MRNLPLALATAAILTTVATAQNQLPALKVKGPINKLQYGIHTPKASPVTVYSNTLPTGYFSLPGIGEEWIDHATVVGNGDHDTIIGHEFGYATYAAAGPNVRIRHYDGYTGFCGSLSGPAWDLTITGLPGGGTSTAAAGWIVALDMSAGDCFFQDNGPFGYSVTYSDSISGPLLAFGGTGNLNRFDWTPTTQTSCGGWWFGGSPWAGFHSAYTGHDGNDSFGAPCGVGSALHIDGATCAGGALTVTVEGTVGDFWALGLGLGAGTGIGGPIGGSCTWDTALLRPPLIMGPLPFSPLSFTVNQSVVAAGVSLGVQVAAKALTAEPDESTVFITKFGTITPGWLQLRIGPTAGGFCGYENCTANSCVATVQCTSSSTPRSLADAIALEINTNVSCPGGHTATASGDANGAQIVIQGTPGNEHCCITSQEIFAAQGANIGVHLGQTAVGVNCQVNNVCNGNGTDEVFVQGANGFAFDKVDINTDGRWRSSGVELINTP